MITKKQKRWIAGSRNCRILAHWGATQNFSATGRAWDLSPQRIRQIVQRFGRMYRWSFERGELNKRSWSTAGFDAARLAYQKYYIDRSKT